MLKLIKWQNVLGILFGSAIFAFGFVHFNIAHALSEGGFTGITLILLFTAGWDPALMNILLNIPVFFIGYKLLGKRSFVYTLIGTVSFSVFLSIFQRYAFTFDLHDDMLLVALFAGIFIGVGLGIIFRFGGTTGGVDIIARLMHKYFGWSMGKTMFAFDAVIILLSWVTFLDARSMMYTLVAVYVGGHVVDLVQDGQYAARGVFIISPKHEEIAERITTHMERGVTVLTGKGYFTKETKDILYCVVPKNETVRIKTIIELIDPHAFVSISEVRDVSGEGFTLDGQKQPLH